MYSRLSHARAWLAQDRRVNFTTEDQTRLSIGLRF